MIEVKERPSKLRNMASTVSALVVGTAVMWYFATRESDEKAMRDMNQGLRSVALAQLTHYLDHGTYFAVMPGYIRPQFWNSNIRIVTASDGGWSATATHRSTKLTCETGVVRVGAQEAWTKEGDRRGSIPMSCK